MANQQQIALLNKSKKTKLRLIFIVFLAFFQNAGNLCIKALSLKVT